MNIIMCIGVHIHTALLEIVDCIYHCAEGLHNDSQYITEAIKPHVVKINTTKLYLDLVILDGASNVQKAGEIQ